MVESIGPDFLVTVSLTESKASLASWQWGEGVIFFLDSLCGRSETIKIRTDDRPFVNIKLAVRQLIPASQLCLHILNLYQECGGKICCSNFQLATNNVIIVRKLYFFSVSLQTVLYGL